jgi:hypothetical protein
MSGIGQLDDLAIWSRALAPFEALRLFTEGIRESDSGLSLFYSFNEGNGAYARNKGRAGGQYDLVLGRSDVGGPTAFEVANRYGGTDKVPFTQPVWTLPASTDGFDQSCRAEQIGNTASKPQATGYGGKLFVILKESTFVQFILEYFHPAGRKSTVQISRPPMHGRLEQVLCANGECSRSPIASAPFEISSSAYASLVRS